MKRPRERERVRAGAGGMSLVGKLKMPGENSWPLQLVWNTCVRVCVSSSRSLALSYASSPSFAYVQRKTCILKKNQKIETRNWVSVSFAIPLWPTPTPLFRLRFQFRSELLVWLQTLAKTCFMLSQFVLFN